MFHYVLLIYLLGPVLAFSFQHFVFPIVPPFVMPFLNQRNEFLLKQGLPMLSLKSLHQSFNLRYASHFHVLRVNYFHVLLRYQAAQMAAYPCQIRRAGRHL